MKRNKVNVSIYPNDWNFVKIAKPIGGDLFRLTWFNITCSGKLSNLPNLITILRKVLNEKEH